MPRVSLHDEHDAVWWHDNKAELRRAPDAITAGVVYQSCGHTCRRWLIGGGCCACRRDAYRGVVCALCLSRWSNLDTAQARVIQYQP